MLPERTDDDVTGDVVPETAPVAPAAEAEVSAVEAVAPEAAVSAEVADVPTVAPSEVAEAEVAQAVPDVAPEVPVVTDEAPAAEPVEAEEAVAEAPADATAIEATADAAADATATEAAADAVEPAQVVVAPAAIEHDDPHHWDGPSVPFVPDHALLEGMMALAFLTVMLGMIAFIPAPLEDRANPYLSPAGVLPEWYFLAPFELLHLVPTLPGMAITGAAVGVLMFWPFIDRKPKRISRRPYLFALSIIIILSLVALSVYSVMKVAAEKVG